jgi:hypothetical protein
MAEVETKELSIDSEEVSMQEYKKARSEGVTTIERPVEPAEEQVEEKEPEATEETKPEDKPKVKGGFQKRIDRLIREKEQEREARERVEARLKELEAKSGKAEEKPAPKNDGRPNQDDFKTYEEYMEAITDWKVDQKLKAQAEQAELEAEQETVSEILESYKERVTAAKAKYEDFDDVVNESVKSPWPEKNATKMEMAAAEAFRTAVFEDENAGEISYYYGKHPDEFLKLGGLTPAQVVKAVARLSDKLGPVETEEKEETEEVEEKPAKIVSKSAPPIKPVSGGNTKSSVSLDQMDMAAYRKARAAGRVR